MQGNYAAQAYDREPAARARAQFQRVAAIRAVQIGKMVFQEFVAFGGADVDVGFIRATMPVKCIGGPGWQYEAEASQRFLGTPTA